MTIPGSANPLLLASAAAAPTGYQISRSVRFNAPDSAFLSRTPSVAGNRKTWTWAGWVKRSSLTSARNFLLGCGPNSNDFFAVEFTNSSDALIVQHYAGGTQYLAVTTQVFRDASAWFHLVLAVDTTQAVNANRVKVCINGFQVTAFSTYSTWPQNLDTNYNRATTTLIGNLSTDFSGYFNGYLADAHFIDGQALDPTSFGEFDANGVWQPKAYTGSYGTNGFHLPFSDNSTAAALGTDTSGNGNDWTTHNLSISEYEGPSYINSSTWTLGGPSSSGRSVIQQPNLFDGNTSTFPSWSGSDVGFNESNWLQWNASGNPIPIPAGATVEIAGDATGTTVINGQTILFTRTITVNGTNFQTPNDNPSVVKWVDVTSAASTELQSIRWTEYVQPYGPVVWAPNPPRGPLAIRINGSLILSPLFSARNDSLVDIPTNYGVDDGLGGSVRGNYATFNPLALGGGTLSNGNLDVASAASHATRNSTIGVSSGKWYAEFNLSSANACGLGITSRNTAYTTWPDNSAGNYWFYYDGSLKYFYPGGGASSSNAGAPATGIWKIALDLDNRKCWIGTGSIWYDSAWNQTGDPSTGVNPTFSSLPAATYFMFVETHTVASWTANFGQRQWAYAAPAGFKALCTTNLPEPLVAKPSEVMDVALYTGNGSTQTISGLGLSPDLAWIKCRSQSGNHALYDTIRGANKRLMPSFINAEITDTQAVTAFNSDGFSLGTDGLVNGSLQTYVAWAWDAGSSTVTNTRGTITSSVRANPSAGFSIVAYTGTSSNASVGHGLGVAPAFIIAKKRNGTSDWLTNGPGLDAPWGGALQMNTTSAFIASSGIWLGLSPTSQVFFIGTADAVNYLAATHVAYCFAPVAGYSAFGSYNGNGSADGPFVYTGFRPRWVMIKASNTAGTNWMLFDTARSAYNLSDYQLYANLSNAEDTANSALDILSNGFKCRADTFNNINGNAVTYIYAAFAEHPFQYARAR